MNAFLYSIDSYLSSFLSSVFPSNVLITFTGVGFPFPPSGSSPVANAASNFVRFSCWSKIPFLSSCNSFTSVSLASSSSAAISAPLVSSSTLIAFNLCSISFNLMLYSFKSVLKFPVLYVCAPTSPAVLSHVSRLHSPALLLLCLSLPEYLPRLRHTLFLS